MKIQRNAYGRTPDGRAVELFSLTNSAGATLRVTNWGAIITSVEVLDRSGRVENVTLGFPSLDGYLQRHPMFGSTVGRFCNRIAAGRFELDGRVYQLAINKEPNHIHGGRIGFDKQVWQAEVLPEDHQQVGVRMTLTSPDGQEGYPGTVQVTINYMWNEKSELTCNYLATTDQSTIINLTNHAYWNLAGCDSGTIHNHILRLACRQFLEPDANLIPTGKILNVSGSALDFLEPRVIGHRLNELTATKGYDHCYVIDGPAGQLRSFAEVVEPTSGRTLEVLTTQPGVQFYTGNNLGQPYPAYSGFCLETQHFPDSPNHPHFPSTRLDPGQTFQQTTVFRFGVTA